ncbi:MAG: HAD family hydrolase, partial [Oscillospiraceae bacterium]|nr:HAD family hydrolase [Oscillospiraceae bacterium]
MKELLYPFDSSYLMKNKKKIRRTLLSDGTQRIKKKIAVLGGSTTNDIVSMLEIFLLNYGIECEFYCSEYNKYWEDAVFPNPQLEEFSPDLIYIHTSVHNITEYRFDINCSKSDMNTMLEKQYGHFRQMWDSISEKYSCPVIQNNFEMPSYRILGNRDCWDIHGYINFITALNMKICEYAADNQNFHINDINYISACCGLDKWSEPSYWYMYKYSVNPCFIPELAFNIANIVKSIFGRNKKVLAVDLDNTLWGGVIGDDGIDGIEIGNETASAECFSAFQKYLKEQKKIGVLLTVASKNDYENAVAGLSHPDSILRTDDFINIKANWNSKDVNISETAEEMGLLPESFVFADDNPAERDIVSAQLGIPSPVLDEPEKYIRILDRNGFFEVTSLSDDDLKRNDMYKANAQRNSLIKKFDSYEDYLKSLEMTAIIGSFQPVDLQRITQLTNKSNQFNLTTRRYTQTEIEDISKNKNYITLCGRLSDKFGDNGIVSVIIGKKNNDCIDVELWLMSCRVLKRDMEYAMLDSLVRQAELHGINKIKGYYYKTKKNSMVKNLFSDFGFEKISENNSQDTIWEFSTENYKNKNNVRKI